MLKKVLKRRDQVGAAAVEFALLFIPFSLLVFGAIDFGYMYNRDSLVNSVARDAGRLASVNTNEAAIVAAVAAELEGFGMPAIGSGVTFSLTCLQPNGVACAGAYDTAKQSGGTAIVRVTYDFEPVTPVGSTFMGDSFTLSSTVKMRIE